MKIFLFEKKQDLENQSRFIFISFSQINFDCVFICISSMKRTTEQVNDGLKKVRLSSGGNQNLQNFTEPPTDPSRSHQDLQIPSPMQQSPYSQAHPPLPTQNQHQMSAKRGPGRPKRQSTSSNSSLVSPSADSNMYDNDPIISPPSVERRRKSSTPTAKTRDTLASPPPISNIKAGTVKSRRRPSKKDQHPTDPDMMPMMSPSGRGNPVALSPLSHLPSPARTPGSISSVSFTHSKDLTVNISDLDKLFGGSDDDEDELSAKVSFQGEKICTTISYEIKGMNTKLLFPQKS